MIFMIKEEMKLSVCVLKISKFLNSFDDAKLLDLT